MELDIHCIPLNIESVFLPSHSSSNSPWKSLSCCRRRLEAKCGSFEQRSADEILPAFVTVERLHYSLLDNGSLPPVRSYG